MAGPAGLLTLARQVAPGFQATQTMQGLNGASGALFDERTSQMMLFDQGGRSWGVFAPSELLSVEVVEDGLTLATKSHGIARAAIGGLVFGGLGLVTGALLGGTKAMARQQTTEIVLVIRTKRLASPIYRIDLFRSKKPVERASPDVKNALRIAEDACALFGLLLDAPNAALS